MNRKITLASASPRRRELLEKIGLNFSIVPADLDENVIPGESPDEYAVRAALDKARAAAAKSGGIVIGADTIVVLDNAILGKPSDAAEAARMLELLSGKKHRVITGLAVLDADTGKAVTRFEVTSVWFRELTRAEISAYVATGEPLDKAGAYGIQEKGALLVQKIEGCYFNVVGLPLSLLGEMLREFGLTLL